MSTTPAGYPAPRADLSQLPKVPPGPAQTAVSATHSPGRPSLRDLAADAVHRVDCGCDNPHGHTLEVWPYYYEIADAVLAVVWSYIKESK